VFDFFKTLFKPTPPSGATAKERLRLVLLSDHLSLAPDVIESLKRDLLEVISRYVEIDSNHADVTFEHREREVAMLASIPITGVRERVRPSELEAASTQSGDNGSAAAGAETLALDPPPVAEAEPSAETPAKTPAPVPVRASNAARPRRRRRKKAPVAPQPGAAPAQSAQA